MDGIIQAEFMSELQEIVGKDVLGKPISLGRSYELLHLFTEKEIIPLIQQKTIAIVELTTCGLISDLLTGSSGASRYYLMGLVPYHTNMKFLLDVSPTLLEYGGPGTVSIETARVLAEKIKEVSGAEIGLAETGLLSSTELLKRRTKKKPGIVYCSIVGDNSIIDHQLSIQTLPRKWMRHEIAFRILLILKKYLEK